MNLFEKIQQIRVELRRADLRPTGKNEFAKYNYFELDDFLPQLNNLMLKYGMTAIASFTSEAASLTAINVEQPEERFVVTSPFSSASLKGCHDVQNVGAVETYQRRYLYQALFDIGENDGLDATMNPAGLKQTQTNTNAERQQNKPQSPNNGSVDDVQMTLAEAREYCFATGKYANVPFSEMDERNLKWIYEESKCPPKTKKAAKLVYEDMQRTKVRNDGSQLQMTELTPEEKGQLPF